MKRLLLPLLFVGCGKADRIDCDALPLALPTARGEVAGVWDAARERLVVFGGDQGTPVNCQSRTDFTGDTWAFVGQCDAFQSLGAAAGPPPRGRHTAVLDAARDRMIVHGGRWREGTSGAYTLRDDAWALDLATDTWSEVATGGPPARANHVAVVAGDKMIVYGGNASTDGASFTPLGDVWSLDLATGAWTEVTTTGEAPRNRLFHAATVSDDGSTMYVYGGGGANAFVGPFYGDLWALDLATFAWTELHDGSGSGVPDGRIWGNLVFDGPRDRLVLWAGHDDGALGNTNQLWAWDLGGGGWTLLSQGDVLDAGGNGFCDFPADFVAPDLASPERRNAGVAAIAGDELIVFGGKSDCGLLDDVWAWDLAEGGWTERSRATTGQICQRATAECESLCF